MAITFLQRKKLQQWLLFALIAVLLLIIFVLWLGFQRKTSVVPVQQVFMLKKEVKINFEVLKNPLLDKLEPFEEIKPFEETKKPEDKTGRENPFLPY